MLSPRIRTRTATPFYHSRLAIHTQQRRPLRLAQRVIREDQRERPQDVGELAAVQPVEMGDQGVQFVEGRWGDKSGVDSIDHIVRADIKQYYHLLP